MLKWRVRLGLMAIVLLALPRAPVVVAEVQGMLFPPEAPVVLYLTPADLVPTDQRIKPTQAASKAIFLHFMNQTAFVAFAADADGHRAFTGVRHSAPAAPAQALASSG